MLTQPWLFYAPFTAGWNTSHSIHPFLWQPASLVLLIKFWKLFIWIPVEQSNQTVIMLNSLKNLPFKYGCLCIDIISVKRQGVPILALTVTCTVPAYVWSELHIRFSCRYVSSISVKLPSLLSFLTTLQGQYWFKETYVSDLVACTVPVLVWSSQYLLVLVLRAQDSVALSYSIWNISVSSISSVAWFADTSTPEIINYRISIMICNIYQINVI